MVKKNVAPFNSQKKFIKINYFVIDFKNILRCYSKKMETKEINFKTEKIFY